MFGHTWQVPKRLCMYTWSVQTWLIWPYRRWSSPYLKVNTIMCSLGSASWLLGRRVCSVIREAGQESGGVRAEETWAQSVCGTARSWVYILRRVNVRRLWRDADVSTWFGFSVFGFMGSVYLEVQCLLSEKMNNWLYFMVQKGTHHKMSSRNRNTFLELSIYFP